MIGLIKKHTLTILFVISTVSIFCTSVLFMLHTSTTCDMNMDIEWQKKTNLLTHDPIFIMRLAGGEGHCLNCV